MLDLEGRVALVIGGAAGMGLASARALAANGAIVVIADRQQEAAQRAAETLTAAGGEAVAYQVDAASIGALEAMFGFVDKTYGKLNILFSNVGMTGPNRFEVSEQEFDEVFNLNLKSHYFATNLAVPLLSRCVQQASIIYMSSGAALHSASSSGGGPRSPLYNISKASMLMMTRSFARQLGPLGIRVNALCPGHVETGFPRAWLGLDETEYQAMIAQRGTAIPLGRIGQPDDVAGVVAFLASDLSRYLTGLAISIDGGQSA